MSTGVPDMEAKQALEDAVRNLRPETVLQAFATQVVSAYVSRNPVQIADIPDVFAAAVKGLNRVAAPAVEAAPPTPVPAVNPKKSVFPDYLICLEDGKKFKSLKRHLMSQFRMTPAEYRERWGLPVDYPMVAPNYAAARSQLAKKMGLGTHRKKAA